MLNYACVYSVITFPALGAGVDLKGLFLCITDAFTDIFVPGATDYRTMHTLGHGYELHVG